MKCMQITSVIMPEFLSSFLNKEYTQLHLIFIHLVSACKSNHLMEEKFNNNPYHTKSSNQGQKIVVKEIRK